jgi:hypothetical protein
MRLICCKDREVEEHSERWAWDSFLNRGMDLPGKKSLKQQRVETWFTFPEFSSRPFQKMWKLRHSFMAGGSRATQQSLFVSFL